LFTNVSFVITTQGNVASNFGMSFRPISPQSPETVEADIGFTADVIIAPTAHSMDYVNLAVSLQKMAMEAQDGSTENVLITGYLADMLNVAERHRQRRMKSSGVVYLGNVTKLRDFLAGALTASSPRRGIALLEMFRDNRSVFDKLGDTVRADVRLGHRRRSQGG
jgi:hypothetical protein